MIKSAKEQLEEILKRPPIKEEVPDDIWGTIYATWTGLWTDGYGQWDEKQPSDIYPLEDILSTEAYDRIVKELMEWHEKNK